MSNPTQLTDSESQLLQEAVEKNQQASTKLSTLVGLILGARQLDIKEWAISLTDYKSIVKNPNQTPPTESVPATEPPIPD